MSPPKNIKKKDKNTWKSRKRTGGIRRKCLKEYEKIKNSTCSTVKKGVDSFVNNLGSSASQSSTVEEDSVQYDFAASSNNLNENYNDNSEDSESSTSDYEKIETEFTKNLNFRNNLRKWAVNKNISQAALKDLIGVINQRLPGTLPVDPRSLLQTPRDIVLKKIEGGEYWHNGLAEPLKNILYGRLDVPDAIHLNLNFDGLPIFKSSKNEFWPILCNIYENPNVEPLVVGIYYGSGKPKCLSQYLQDFVTEMQNILENGICIIGKAGEQKVAVKIRCFICDSPARAFIKGVCNFNAKQGCLKCTTVGEYSHQSHTVIFPNARCPKRTDEDFRLKKYGQHHKTDTPLLRLPIDMIEDFPVSDSLHLIDLGVMKRLLVGWRDGNFGKLITKWRAQDTQKVTNFLRTCKLPSEIHRSVRGLDELLHWKASEFRSFFYYLSIIILPEVLSKEPYEHFLTLFCSIVICSSQKYIHFLELSHELALHFVENFRKFYGDYMTSNIHNLVHVTDEVRKFGPLNTFNSYPFENKLYVIKRMLRDGNKPLTQVAKRLKENKADTYLKYVQENEPSYPLIKKSRNKNVIDYGTFKISHKTHEKYFMNKEGEIIEVKEVTEKNIKGYKILNVSDIFQTPLKSSYLSMYKANIPDGNRKTVDIHFGDVSYKLVCNTYNKKLYFIPLLHTLVT